MMVNKENMRLVVAALRSGKYLQGHGRLKEIFKDGTGSRYCCMGVICEVAMEHGVVLEATTYPLKDFSESVKFDGSAAFLRKNVLDWLGLDANGDGEGDLAVGTDGNEAIPASYANDELKWDFLQIAESMEKHYKLLEDDDEPTSQH